MAPTDPVAATLFNEVIACEDTAIEALVLETKGAAVTTITIPGETRCQSVTITAQWDGEAYRATFSDLPAEPAPTATP